MNELSEIGNYSQTHPYFNQIKKNVVIVVQYKIHYIKICSSYNTWIVIGNKMQTNTCSKYFVFIQSQLSPVHVAAEYICVLFH